MSSTHVLITGINGFVGRILRRSLEDRGYRVSGIDIASMDPAVLKADITDAAAVMKCMEELSPDFIFHLAAISQTDSANPALLYSINVTGTLNVISAAVRTNNKPGLLLVSSAQVYGIVDDARQPIREDSPIMPVNHYGASKAACEHIARVFHYDHDLPLIIVRPFNHTGRGQDPHFIIPKIAAAIRGGKESIELGDLSVIRDFLDVRDVADAYIRLMERLPDGETFNVSSGTGYRLTDLFSMMQEISGARLAVRTTGSLMRKKEIARSIGDASALQHCLNWRPAYGIRNTLEWILSE